MLIPLENFDLELQKTYDDEESVLESVREQLDDIEARRSEILERRERARDEYIWNHTPEDLLDPLKAPALYEYGFDSGSGSLAFIELYEALMEGSYLSSMPNWWTLKGEKQPVREPTFILEESYDEKVFDYTLELLEQLYEAALEANPTVKIAFLGEPGFSITRTATGWRANFPKESSLESESLKDSVSLIFGALRG